MNIIKNKFFTLKSVDNDDEDVFSLIQKNLPTSVFSIIDNNFYKNILKKKIISIFVISNKKKKSVIITVVTTKNLPRLKYQLVLFFLLNPFKFLFNILKIIKSLNRSSDISFNSSHLYLLHFIIFKKNFFGVPLDKKDQIINFFLKKITKFFNAKYLYLCYERNNLKAKNFYLRNNFKSYGHNKMSVFLKKKLR